jgi:hypothetical protein
MINPSDSISDERWEKGFGSMYDEMMMSEEEWAKRGRIERIEEDIRNLSYFTRELKELVKLYPDNPTNPLNRGRVNATEALNHVETAIRLLLNLTDRNF